MLRAFVLSIALITTAGQTGCIHRPAILTPAQSKSRAIGELRQVLAEYDTMWKHEFVRAMMAANDDKTIETIKNMDDVWTELVARATAALNAGDISTAKKYIGFAAGFLTDIGLIHGPREPQPDTI